jgi:hypothetical protein
VLFGLARASQRGDGGRSLTEVARLPGNAEALAATGPNLFAARSEGRVIVFSDKKSLGRQRASRKEDRKTPGRGAMHNSRPRADV